MGDRREFGLCVIIDDDEDILTATRLLLRGLFDEVVALSTPEEALALVATRTPDVVLLDANFARGATDAAEGLVLLDRLLAADAELVVVMITAHAGVNVAVEALK
ncbi:MAG TPA: response regulator, partial [Sphingomonas sp.]